jgi:hypothetical protein
MPQDNMKHAQDRNVELYRNICTVTVTVATATQLEDGICSCLHAPILHVYWALWQMRKQLRVGGCTLKNFTA